MFTASPIPVTGGARHCLSARVHVSSGAGAFLGLNLSDAAGTRFDEHWLIGAAGHGDGFGGQVTPVPDDPTRYDLHHKEFVVPVGATHVVLKDELWVGGAPGTAHFTAIRLIEDPCGAGPGDPPDTDTPPLDTWTASTSEYGVVSGLRDADGNLIGDKPGCGCATSTPQPTWALMALLPLLRRRRGLLAALWLLSACTPDGDDKDVWSIEDGMKLGGIAPPPPLWTDPERPMSHGDVAVGVEDLDAQRIQLTVAGSGCGTLTGAEGTTSLRLDGRAALRGTCRIQADITPADGSPAYTLTRAFEVQSSRPELPPFDVPEGVWITGPSSWRSGLPNAPLPPVVLGPMVFINGASLTFEVDIDTSAPLRALVITFAGTEGSWLVPFDLDGVTSFAVTRKTFTLRVPSGYFDRKGADQAP